MSQINKKQFDRSYADKTYSIDSVYDHIIRIRHRYLSDKSGRLFDHGFGNGVNAMYFEREGFDVYGVDVSESAKQLIDDLFPDKKDHYHQIGVTQTEFPFDDGFFDVAVSNQVIYFIPDLQQIQSTLKELHRILKPGGKLVMTTMAEENCYFTDYSDGWKIDQGVVEVTVKGRIERHFNIFKFKNAEAFADLIKQAGFEVDHLGYFDFGLMDTSCAKHHIVLARKP